MLRDAPRRLFLGMGMEIKQEKRGREKRGREEWKGQEETKREERRGEKEKR